MFYQSVIISFVALGEPVASRTLCSHAGGKGPSTTLGRCAPNASAMWKPSIQSRVRATDSPSSKLSNMQDKYFGDCYNRRRPLRAWSVLETYQQHHQAFYQLREPNKQSTIQSNEPNRACQMNINNIIKSNVLLRQ